MAEPSGIDPLTSTLPVFNYRLIYKSMAYETFLPRRVLVIVKPLSNNYKQWWFSILTTTIYWRDTSNTTTLESMSSDEPQCLPQLF